MSFIKNIFIVLLNKIFYKILVRLDKISFGKVFNKIRKFQNIYNNKRAFIIGNGPSLSAIDLDLLKNEITFASNKIYLLLNKFDWRPTFYTVEDNLVFDQNVSDILSYNDSHKIYPDYSIKHIGFDRATLVRYNRNLKLNEFDPNNKINLDSKGLYWLGSVVHTQIQLAIYMGIKEIYLLGVDFNFKTSKNTSDIIIGNKSVNHFSSDYRKPGELWNSPKLDLQIKGYKKLNLYAKKYGIKIINCTDRSKLTIFKQIAFKNIL